MTARVEVGIPQNNSTLHTMIKSVNKLNQLTSKTIQFKQSITFVFVCLLSLIVISTSMLMIRRTQNHYKNTIAKVVKVKNDKCNLINKNSTSTNYGCIITYEYNANKKKFTNTVYMNSPTDLPRTVDIQYNKENPNISRIKSKKEIIIGTLIILVSLFCIIIHIPNSLNQLRTSHYTKNGFVVKF